MKRKHKLAIICLFFGCFGVHRFMAGNKGLASLLTLGGLGYWALYDFIQLLRGKFLDKDGNPITD